MSDEEVKKQSPWTLQNFGRVDFKDEEFERAIHQRGARIIWEKSMFCSCINEHSGQPAFDCIGCNGKGYVYFGAEQIRGVVSGLTGDKSQIPIGLMDVGSCLLTAKASDKIGFRDRLTFDDFRVPYSQVLTYDSTDSDGVKLKYECEEIISVRVLNVEIPATDYTLSEDKQHLTFIGESPFQDGERFAVLCRIKPVYIVIDIPHELRGTFVKFMKPDETWIELPKQYMLKREDLLPLRRGELS